MQDSYKHRLHHKNDLKLVWNKGFLFTCIWNISLCWNVFMAPKNVTGFHDVVSVINVQNFYQTVQ